MVPPCRRTTMRLTTSRPRPVPSPTALVVKKGSQMRDLISSGMPGPSSRMSTRSSSPSRAARTSTRPPGATASMALSSRLVQTWFSSPGKASIGGRSRSKSRVTWTPFLRSLWARIVSVTSSSCRRSISARPWPLSMCEKDLTAATSSEMRWAALAISESSPSAARPPSIQLTRQGRKVPGATAASPSSSDGATPNCASVPATTAARSTWCASSQVASASSRSLIATGSSSLPAGRARLRSIACR